MSHWYCCGAAFLSACTTCPRTPCPDPNLRLLCCQSKPLGKLYHIIPSFQQMPITLLIACFTAALTRLIELNFRICYRRVMEAGYCASIWQHIGTAIEILYATICGFQPTTCCKSLSFCTCIYAALRLPRDSNIADQQLG